MARKHDFLFACGKGHTVILKRRRLLPVCPKKGCKSRTLSFVKAVDRRA